MVVLMIMMTTMTVIAHRTHVRIQKTRKKRSLWSSAWSPDAVSRWRVEQPPRRWLISSWLGSEIDCDHQCLRDGDGQTCCFSYQTHSTDRETQQHFPGFNLKADDWRFNFKPRQPHFPFVGRHFLPSARRRFDFRFCDEEADDEA